MGRSVQDGAVFQNATLDAQMVRSGGQEETLRIVKMGMSESGSGLDA